MSINNQVNESQLKSYIKNQWAASKIAKELHISKSSVQRLLKKYNLKTLHTKIPLSITKEELQKLIDLNMSSYKIAAHLGVAQTTVRHWLNKFKLKTNSTWTINRKKIKKEIETGNYTCRICNISKPITPDYFYKNSNGSFHRWCKNCNNQITYEKQIQRKKEAVKYKGGKCIVCGYNKYFGALDFHHLDPSKKEFNIGRLKTYSIDKLKTELDKCVCVCRNCHAEIHHGLIDLNKLVLQEGFEPSTKPL
jgi:transposase